MKIKVVGFDLDNTLYDQKQYEYNLFDSIADQIGRDFKLDKEIIFKKLCEQYEKGTKHRFFDEIIKKLSLCEEKAEEYIKFVVLPIYRGKVENLKPWSDRINFAEKIKELSLKISLITNGRVEAQQNKLETLGITHLFDLILISDSYYPPRRKPDLFMFEQCLDFFDIKGSEMIYIGDNDTEDGACEELGIKFFNINKGNWKEEVLECLYS